MSAAEIADNKWESQASKPNFISIGAIGAILMMTGLCIAFVWMIIGSVRGMFTEPSALTVDKAAQQAPAEAAPAAE